ncbi:hypoxanthine phosphoribosyltransferase [Haliovirga abyssi]|uniref:Hypoxanthine phosphoribosyltransferase n=1 Tax=Haliovirga abyssi TaxID=2996794 RepID=A0AAU9DW94_9FUSO|nr:hypoxanthine phosphoribosyltransferase [Haliovirga abyssi]BDU50536.1 hypoxanthine phosphoribosyltransferase [Haliovirga abyssi]
MNNYEIEVFISKDEIAEKVKKLGKIITDEYKNTKELVVIGLLRGSVIFLSDLVRELDLPVSIDFMTVSSYGNEMESTREVKIIKDLDENIMGKDVLIVEDILDSGLTLKKVMGILESRSPNSLKLSVLLNKTGRREADISPDYIGFEFEDGFVVGYGIDYAQKHRNLPYIGIVKEVK